MESRKIEIGDLVFPSQGSFVSFYETKKLGIVIGKAEHTYLIHWSATPEDYQCWQTRAQITKKSLD